MLQCNKKFNLFDNIEINMAKCYIENGDHDLQYSCLILLHLPIQLQNRFKINSIKVLKLPLPACFLSKAFDVIGRLRLEICSNLTRLARQYVTPPRKLRGS